MTTQTTNRKEAKLPKFHAYFVTETNGGAKKARWTRIGAFFDHEDGLGGTLILDSLPIAFDGRIVLRAPKDTAEGEAR